MKYHIEFELDFKRNTFPGKFIAIEGIDGSGKTTQAQRAVEELKKQGRDALYTKEPTDEPTGKFIRQVLSGQISVPPISLQYMYGADRAVHLEKVKKWLADGKIIVTDRYFWSSVAYAISDLTRLDRHQSRQEGAGDLYLTAFSILSHYNQFLIPDISFFLKTSVDTAVARIEETGKQREIYDHRNRLINIFKGYDWVLQKFPNEFTIIDSEKPIEEVTVEILSAIQNSKFPSA